MPIVTDPKISIITINYNNAEGLEKTINSVISQTYEPIEYLVIDGGSTDESKAVILRAAAKINYWRSETDRGIYHAMNKGIEASSGEYLLFLNSGDFLTDPNVIADLVAAGMEEELIYGNLIYEENNKKWCPSTKLTFQTFLEDTIPHPSTFIKRDLFSKVGKYNESNRVISDWEFFMLAVCKFSCSYRYIDRDISRFMSDGISSNPASMEGILKERAQALEAHFSSFLPDYKQHAELKSELKKINYFIRIRSFVKDLFRFKKKDKNT